MQTTERQIDALVHSQRSRLDGSLVVCRAARRSKPLARKKWRVVAKAAHRPEGLPACRSAL
eukprot:2286525-Amphidinium_carterae.1